MTTQANIVTTRESESSPAVQTTLTVDWTDCTDDMLKRIAHGAIVIRVQSKWRKNGIPESATVRAVDYVPGTRHAPAPATVTVDKLVSMSAGLSAIDREALLARLEASTA